MARLLAVLLAGLALGACGGGEDIPSPAPVAQACTAAGVRQTVKHVLGALDAGAADTLDEAFAQPPVFRWYAAEPPGKRLDEAARARGTLRSYLERRAELNERMTLTSFRFRGRRGDYSHFELDVTRTADDLVDAPFLVRGAVSCADQRGKLALWSLARR